MRPVVVFAVLLLATTVLLAGVHPTQAYDDEVSRIASDEVSDAIDSSGLKDQTSDHEDRITALESHSSF